MDSVHAQEYSCGGLKLRALIYNILPPTSATTDYAIVLEKLSANGTVFAVLKRQ